MIDQELRTAILEAGQFFAKFNRLFDAQKEQADKPERLSRYLSKAEAAMILDVSTKTIDRYVRSGKLPKRMLGDSVRFLESDVRDLVK